jgi:uncharacterized protein YbgA (DUF1722 family)/uncharacterized protein YbbK (DUF523 family)
MTVQTVKIKDMESFERLPLRIGISACLLGENVRFDGGNKRDPFINELLGKYFEWAPVCPEVEVGMGVPREAVQLAGRIEAPRMLGVRSRNDWTSKMQDFAKMRCSRLQDLHLSGFVFKSRSPSCGIDRIPVYNSQKIPVKKGHGLFSKIFTETFPLVPVEDEGRLNDSRIRENFIVRVFAYGRLQQMLELPFSRSNFIRFHTIHKYLLLSHSPKHYSLLGRIAARPDKPALQEYAPLFMAALGIKSTVKKNVNVLLHILGYLKNQLALPEKADLLDVIGQYGKELVPLIVPITLLKHYVKKFDIQYIKNQVYLDPHPRELMLRNHV